MDVDTLRKKHLTPGACYRCGSTEHLVKDCPHPYNVRAMPIEEQTALLELLMAAADIRDAEMAHVTGEDDEIEDLGQNQEDFGSSRG